MDAQGSERLSKSVVHGQCSRQRRLKQFILKLEKCRQTLVLVE